MMEDRGRNKFGFVLRILERRLRAVEGRLGIASGANPLNVDRRNAETKETTDGRTRP